MKAIPVPRQILPFLAAGALLFGCETQHQVSAPDGPQPQFAKGGGGGSVSFDVDVVTDPDWTPPSGQTPITSTCPGASQTPYYHAFFRERDGIDPYCLTVELAPNLHLFSMGIGIGIEKGKTIVTYAIRGVGVEDGAFYNLGGAVPVAWPQGTQKVEFTLHLHGDNLPVYLLDANDNPVGGPVGSITIADLHYTPQ